MCHCVVLTALNLIVASIMLFRPVPLVGPIVNFEAPEAINKASEKSASPDAAASLKRNSPAILISHGLLIVYVTI